MSYQLSEINTFQKLVTACGWTEIDGELPGVFSYLPSGNKCVWAAKWIASDGIIDPQNTGPGEAYPDLLEAELLDYYYQGDSDANTWITKLRKEPGEASTHGAFVHCLRNRRLMAEAREPYYWPFGPLNRAVVIRLQRPGSWCADTISYNRKLRMEEAAKVAMS
jgi:hypothetical protein